MLILGSNFRLSQRVDGVRHTKVGSLQSWTSYCHSTEGLARVWKFHEPRQPARDRTLKRLGRKGSGARPQPTQTESAWKSQTTCLVLRRHSAAGLTSQTTGGHQCLQQCSRPENPKPNQETKVFIAQHDFVPPVRSKTIQDHMNRIHNTSLKKAWGSPAISFISSILLVRV